MALRILCVLVIMASVWPRTASSASLRASSRGQVALEGRGFLPDDDPSTTDYGLGLFGRAEARLKKRPWAGRLRVAGRVDTVDKGRSYAWVEELWAEWKSSAVRLRIGADIVNWTATEAFHPADILNSRNLDSDFRNLDKVGEPMARLAVDVGDGLLEFIGLPMVVRPLLPSPRSRFNFLRTLDPDPAVRIIGADGRISKDRFAPQGAIRWSQSFRGADLSLQAVHHVDRNQPVVAYAPATSRATMLLQTVTHAGVTWTQTVHGVILKFEGAWRHFWPADTSPTAPFDYGDRDHIQLAPGLEYTRTAHNGWDLTPLMEAQVMIPLEGGDERQLGLFQRDLLVGLRVATNDTQSRELLLAAILDLQNAGELLGMLTFQQRIGDAWQIEGALQWLSGPGNDPVPTGLQALDGDHQLSLRLARFF